LLAEVLSKIEGIALFSCSCAGWETPTPGEWKTNIL
jgi:hypothetical protein